MWNFDKVLFSVANSCVNLKEERFEGENEKYLCWQFVLHQLSAQEEVDVIFIFFKKKVICDLSQSLESL